LIGEDSVVEYFEAVCVEFELGQGAFVGWSVHHYVLASWYLIDFHSFRFKYFKRAFEFRLKLEAFQAYITEGSKKYVAAAIETSDILQRDQPLELKYNWTVKNAVTAFDNEIYIDLNQRKIFHNATFDEKRTLDFVFPFKYRLTDETTFKIPAGYQVTELPPAVSVSNPDFNITIAVGKEDDRVFYRSHFAFPNARISKQNFDAWNSAMKSLKECYAHQLVIAKPD
jgi:hypothetical protein